jgi:hypothetical protein
LTYNDPLLLLKLVQKVGLSELNKNDFIGEIFLIHSIGCTDDMLKRVARKLNTGIYLDFFIVFSFLLRQRGLGELFPALQQLWFVRAQPKPDVFHICFYLTCFDKAINNSLL